MTLVEIKLQIAGDENKKSIPAFNYETIAIITHHILKGNM